MASSKTIPFELHITTADLTGPEADVFVACCTQQEAKPMIIELARGKHLRQPMLNKVIPARSLEEALTAADNLSRALMTHGLHVQRLKIEVPATHAADPFTVPAGFAPYFEWHGKVAYANPDALQALCIAHGAHLSINALKGETGTRFVTLREVETAAIFQDRIEALTQALTQGGWKITKHQSEYCIYDNNIHLDNGWLRP